MDLKLKTGSRPNPVWEIHWRLTGQTHMYGWVDIQGIRCRVTMARVKQGGRVEVGFGHDPAKGTYTLTPAGDCMVLPIELAPYLGGHMEVEGVTTEGVLVVSEIPFVNMAEQSAWEEYYVGLKAGEIVHEPDAPKRDFFHHQVLAADFTQEDTDKVFAAFGFRSHAALAEDE